MGSLDMLPVSSTDRPDKHRRAAEAARGEFLAKAILCVEDRDSVCHVCESSDTFLRASDVLALCECIAAQHPEWASHKEQRGED